MKVSSSYFLPVVTSLINHSAVIAERRRNPTDKKDLLNIMLYSKDPKTGQSLSDVNIRNNVTGLLLIIILERLNAVDSSS